MFKGKYDVCAQVEFRTAVQINDINNIIIVVQLNKIKTVVLDEIFLCLKLTDQSTRYGDPVLIHSTTFVYLLLPSANRFIFKYNAPGRRTRAASGWVETGLFFSKKNIIITDRLEFRDENRT